MSKQFGQKDGELPFVYVDKDGNSIPKDGITLGCVIRKRYSDGSLGEPHKITPDSGPVIIEMVK